MFKNVLIAEDHESINISVRKTVEESGVNDVDYVYYCDDALIRLQKGVLTGNPYDLLITDLVFEADHYHQKLFDGEALIEAARSVQPNLKVLVFSTECRAVIIDNLFNKFSINGYVRKARNDAQELKLALTNIYKGRPHFPVQLRQAVSQKNTHEFTEFDITILNLLLHGVLQKDIPAYLENNAIRPSSLSSLEKRLNVMKESLGFSKNEQLVAFSKDMGII